MVFENVYKYEIVYLNTVVLSYEKKQLVKFSIRF